MEVGGMCVHIWKVEAMRRKKQEGKDNRSLLITGQDRAVFQKGNWLHPKPLTADLDFRKQKVYEDESFYPSSTQYTFCV